LTNFFIFIFLILTICLLPFSELLSFKPVNYTVIKSYFIISFLLFFTYFTWSTIRFIYINYFIVIVILPFIRQQVKEATNLWISISFLYFTYLLIMVFVFKNYLFLYIFLWEAKNFYSTMKKTKASVFKINFGTKTIISKGSFFEWLQSSTQFQLALPLFAWFLVIELFILGNNIIPSLVQDAVVPLPPKKIAWWYFFQTAWIFSWIGFLFFFDPTLLFY